MYLDKFIQIFQSDIIKINRQYNKPGDLVVLFKDTQIKIEFKSAKMSKNSLLQFNFRARGRKILSLDLGQ